MVLPRSLTAAAAAGVVARKTFHVGHQSSMVPPPLLKSRRATVCTQPALSCSVLAETAGHMVPQTRGPAAARVVTSTHSPARHSLVIPDAPPRRRTKVGAHDCMQRLPVHAYTLLLAPEGPHPEEKASVKVTYEASAAVSMARMLGQLLEWTRNSENWM